MDSSADKEGLQSSGRKEQSSRHGAEPSPATGPVSGAFGQEGQTRVPSQQDADVLDDDELDFDEDDLDLDMDEDDDAEVTDDEAERADGA
jgi:hypothetical protein